MNLIRYVVAALIVEALWETSKLFWQNGKLSFDRIGAVAFGEIIALGAGLDFLAAVGIPLRFTIVGILLTGLLISRGANFMHDFIETMGQMQSNIKIKNNKITDDFKS